MGMEALAAAARWSEPVQLALASDVALHPLLARNPHLGAPAVAKIAAGAGVGLLVPLLRSRGADLTGLAACAARIPQALGQEPRGWERNQLRRMLDRELAWALLRARDSRLAAQVAAAVPLAAVREHTARVLLVLGVATTACLRRVDRRTRLLWALTDAGRQLSDEAVAELTRQRPGEKPVEGLEEVVLRGLLAQQRPGLGRDLGAPRGRSVAALMLERTGTYRQPWRSARARFVAMTPDRVGQLAGGQVLTAPPALAQPAWGDPGVAHLHAWSTEHLRLLELAAAPLSPATMIGRVAFTTPYTPWLAMLMPELSWTGLVAATQVRQAALIPHGTGPGPGDPLASLGFVEEMEQDLLGRVQRELADPDPVVEAARWSLVLRLAEGFRGTVEQLGQVARAVTAP